MTIATPLIARSNAISVRSDAISAKALPGIRVVAKLHPVKAVPALAPVAQPVDRPRSRAKITECFAGSCTPTAFERSKVVARWPPADVGSRLDMSIVRRAGVRGGKNALFSATRWIGYIVCFLKSGSGRQSSDLDQCKFVGTISKADQGIAACDRVIQDSKVTGPARAAAFSNRCGWWWAKKDPDHALSDCNEAIKVDQHLRAGLHQPRQRLSEQRRLRARLR